MSAVAPEGARPTTFDEALDLRPDLAALYRDLLDRLWTDAAIDPVVLELCRLRQAHLLGCQPELGRRTRQAVVGGLDEEALTALSNWPTDARFDAVARACLAYTEAFVIDPHGVDDAAADRVRELTGETGLVALTLALGLFDGRCRLQLSLEVD